MRAQEVDHVVDAACDHRVHAPITPDSGAAATRGLPAEFDELVRRPFVPTANSTFTDAARGTDLIHIADVAENPDPENPLRTAVIELGPEGARRRATWW